MGISGKVELTSEEQCKSLHVRQGGELWTTGSAALVMASMLPWRGVLVAWEDVLHS